MSEKKNLYLEKLYKMNIVSTPVSGLCKFEINDKTIHDELEVTDDFPTTTSSVNALVSEKFDVEVVQDAD